MDPNPNKLQQRGRSISEVGRLINGIFWNLVLLAIIAFVVYLFVS